MFWVQYGSEKVDDGSNTENNGLNREEDGNDNLNGQRGWINGCDANSNPPCNDDTNKGPSKGYTCILNG